MKLTISKDELIRGLQIILGTIPSRATIPILDHVLLSAESGRSSKWLQWLQLTGTDLDMMASCAVEADVKKSGKVTIPAKRLFNLVREVDSPEIEIEVDQKHACNVRAGSSFFKLYGLEPDEFPPRHEFKESGTIIIAQEKARAMLRKTCFCMSTDESRYALQGVHFAIKTSRLAMVATDGRRLALVEDEFYPEENRDSLDAGEFIVPAKAARELHRLLQDEGTLQIRWCDNQASFTLKPEKGFETVITSKLIEGKYPNYRKIIPEESKERIGLVREEFLHALRRAAMITSDSSDSITLTFFKNNLTITAHTPGIGEVRETMAINYKGKEIKIAFASRFLIEPLNALGARPEGPDEIFLELTDDKSPGVLKSTEPFLYVLMPMRVS